MREQQAQRIREHETVATFYSSLGKQNVYLLKSLDLPIHLFLESTLVPHHLGIFLPDCFVYESNSLVSQHLLGSGFQKG